MQLSGGGVLISSVVMNAIAAGAAETPTEKIYAQGESIEFFFLDKLKDAGAVKGLLTTISGDKVDLGSCSSMIAEIVNNNTADDPKDSYLVKVRPPRLDTLLGLKTYGVSGNYACFGLVGKKGNEYVAFKKKVSQAQTTIVKYYTVQTPTDEKSSFNDLGLESVTTIGGGERSDDNTASNLYYLKKDQIQNVPHIEVGATYGFMYIPFKRYVGGGGLKGGTTVGAYAGYKSFFPESGLSFTPVIAFGFADQKYDALDQTTSKVKEFNGGMLSLAAGLTWGFSYDKFKVGLLYGLDDRSSNDPSAPSFSSKWWSVMFGIGIDPSSLSLWSWSKPKSP